ncbi:MAG: hypothetical protein KC448_02565 [Yoonia sp.]|nr:hypothetical protein [Yoonia sp.]
MKLGAKRKVTKTGLIVDVPRIYNPKFPSRGIAVMLAAAVLFKGYIYADLGQADYASRVAALSGPSIVEKAGSWVMQPESATVFVASFFKKLGA